MRDEGYLGYTDGHLTIWFVRAEAARVRRKPPTGDEEVVAEHLAFEAGSPEQVETFQRELERLDIYPTFRGEEHPEFRPGYFSAVWADPDQVVLEVYAVGRPRRAAAARRPRKKRSRARGR